MIKKQLKKKVYSLGDENSIYKIANECIKYFSEDDK